MYSDNIAPQTRASASSGSAQSGKASQQNTASGSSRVEAVVRLHMWLETGDGVAFGMGRLLLLEAVKETGSLKAASEHLQMSYRAAWGKIKATEQALDRKLVEKSGGNRSGYHLTAYGEELAQRFREWFDEVERSAVAKARDMFQFEMRRFEEQCADGPKKGVC